MSDPTELELLAQLLDGLPSVLFCTKDTEGRYTAVNPGFVRRTGRRRATEVIGRTAGELFPADLAASYDAQDRALLATGTPVRNQLEPISDGRGGRRWYLTNKVLRRTGAGQAAAIVVVSVEATLPRSDPGTRGGVLAVIDFVQEHFGRSLRVVDLAGVAGLSPVQLERAMRRSLGSSPKQYVQRVRLDAAATLLATTDVPLSDVAVRCGFYDQSQLTRLFRASTGVTPGRYRDDSRFLELR